ncbi:hypothetical protein WJX81_002400 [Elliptochloris bilobata]|uniref:N-acetyltransferase domain-containing protein n=1 Tax=Elliptochloris bilobata TaxID=381761 RepID=A0AAW1REI6_9CHLO
MRSSRTRASVIMGCLDVRSPATGPWRSRDYLYSAGEAPGAEWGAYVSSLVVAQGSRRQGVGIALIHAAKAAAAEHWGAAWLCTHVAADNTAASALYAKCGFEALRDNSLEQPALSGAAELGGPRATYYASTL